MLHVAVGRISVTFLLLARRVETNQIPRDILYLVLRSLFESFPCTASKSCYRGFRTLTTLVFADAVQVMDAHKHVRPVAVDQFDHLLRFTVHRCRHQPAKLGNTMVAMYDVVAYLQLVDLPQRDNSFSAPRVLTRHRHTVVTLKDLMIRVATDLKSLIHKPLM